VARKAAPVVVILDEADSLAAKRGGGAGEGSRAMDSGLNIFLQYLDGVEQILDVFWICITNRADMLDEAFTRSGRIGRLIHVGKPDEETRREIFNVHLKRVKGRLKGVDVHELARLSVGMVGADVKEVVRQAVVEAFYEHLSTDGATDFVLLANHFKQALNTVGDNVRRGNR
jgi:transitional endoplasmic reticulum ATPase